MIPELAWQPAWRSAQQLWGVSLHDPDLVAEPEPPSFAWFSFPPQVTVDVPALLAADAAGELESVFAHEIGHHVLAPSTRLDSLKLRHQLGRALQASDRQPHPDTLALLSNLWSDQLINLRVAALQRRHDPEATPGMIRLWRVLCARPTSDRFTWVLRRAYELSWALPPGTLCRPDPPVNLIQPKQRPRVDEEAIKKAGAYQAQERKLQQAQAARRAAEQQIEAGVTADPAVDAQLLARLCAVFAHDPISGALAFGMLAAPYLHSSGEASQQAQHGCAGEADPQPPTPGELGSILGDPRLSARATHPAAMPALTGQPTGTVGTDATDGELAGQDVGTPGDPIASSLAQGYSLANTLALYDPSLAEAVMAAWYRNEARPWVKPLTEQRPLDGADELPGPLEQWELGDDLADLDWPGSLTAAPELLPGITTRRRAWLDDPERPRPASLRLDLYIDSSGSMPNPRRGSPAVLAGAILALSVLRGGGAVRPTSWASSGQVAGPKEFLRDPVAVMAGISFFFGGGTSFPLDLLHERYARLPDAGDTVRRHLVVLSDDGLDSMFGVGNEPFATVAAQVRPKLTTATLVLLDHSHRVEPLAQAAGYQVVYLNSMDEAPAVCARLAEVIHG